MITDDPKHPDINVPGPDGQNKAYLVLSKEERAKGWVRPFRDKYVHNKCGTITRMNAALSETYARDPNFYGRTFCAHCGSHFPVGEFVWAVDNQVVGS